MDILLDLDGTLIDPRPGILGSIRVALQRMGLPAPPIDELTWAIGPSLRTTFPRLLGGHERTEEAVALYREAYADGAMYDAVVYAGIPEALEALAGAGGRLFIATAKPHHFARPIIERFDLARHFTGIFGPELDGTRDQKHELIAHMIASAGVRPERAVMIGDREHDMLAAARNGLPAIGVTWGYGSIAELEAAGASALCATPAGLAEAVRSLGQR